MVTSAAHGVIMDIVTDQELLQLLEQLQPQEQLQPLEQLQLQQPEKLQPLPELQLQLPKELQLLPVIAIPTYIRAQRMTIAQIRCSRASTQTMEVERIRMVGSANAGGLGQQNAV